MFKIWYILGLTPYDWDICTNAHPENVCEVFKKYNVIKTGISHGTVTLIYDDGQYGKTIEINHGNDIVAIYSGLDEIMVEVGDVVAVNMQIATLGKVPCESVETAHLHLAIKKGEKYISPLSIMGV